MSLYHKDKDFGCACVESLNQVLRMLWKSGCTSVVYNVVDKDFRFQAVAM